jgi:hypothetical protein
MKMSTEPLTQDPSAEEIVGAENVIDVGSATDGTYNEAGELGAPQAYRCDEPGCQFSTSSLSEIEEHSNGTGHGKWGLKENQQPKLFSEKGVVHRNVEIRLPDDIITERKDRLAHLYQSMLEVREEKKSADDDFNARIKNIDNQMQEIARVLKTPFTLEKVDCEWRIIEGENARGLYRLDTGALIETEALTQEDREAELKKALIEGCAHEFSANLLSPDEDIQCRCGLKFSEWTKQQPVTDAIEVEPQEPLIKTEQQETGDFVNNRYKNRKKKKPVPEAVPAMEKSEDEQQ